MSEEYFFEFENYSFDWNEEKNKANTKKHGISFAEAEEVFDDPYCVIIPDTAHSYNEERFVVIGYNNNDRLLVVCFCERLRGKIIRIISARKADKAERKCYERGF